VQVDAKLAQNLFKLDKQAHIAIDQRICATLCTRRALSWHYPRGGYGVQYRLS
jgi:ferredoxin-like protein FixX